MIVSVLHLNKNCERRLRQGHQWVYSNEVDAKKSTMKSFQAGEQVLVAASDGSLMGTAVMSPTHLICARLISRNPEQFLDGSLLVHRLNIALSLRDRMFAVPCYRLVFGDSDGLPGLVIDRFFDVCVVQISSPAMEQMKQAIVDALLKVVKPKTIVFKNDGKMRALEGLPEYCEFAVGAEQEALELEENGVRFVAPLVQGQKTGWFFDHRMNRLRMQSYVKGKRVLDLFSYVGGWGIQAAAAGAASLTFVDASALAVNYVHQNARLNSLQNVRALEGDVFEVCQQLKADGEKFDVVVADPPAFIPRKKDEREGLNAYHRLNQMAMRLLDRDGILISGSCSMHLSREQLRDTIRHAGRKIDRFVQILEEGGQGPDHPIIPAIPETDYLKACFVRVLPTF